MRGNLTPQLMVVNGEDLMRALPRRSWEVHSRRVRERDPAEGTCDRVGVCITSNGGRWLRSWWQPLIPDSNTICFLWYPEPSVRRNQSPVCGRCARSRLAVHSASLVRKYAQSFWTISSSDTRQTPQGHLRRPAPETNSELVRVRGRSVREASVCRPGHR